jgi:hypothetical protein
MTITSIISAIGNTRSVYPLILRDCGIEVPSKIYITRKENLKESKTKANDATREKFIDEYVTSAVWLGGIPLVEKVSDKFIKNKGYNPAVSTKLFKEEQYQGLEYNIKKFKELAPQAVKDLEKVKNNSKIFEKLNAYKFASAIAIPVLLMGFVLPKLNFALTRKIKENRKNNNQAQKTFKRQISMTSFAGGKDINFTGNWVSSVANLKTVDKMAITDGGLTVGRVSTSRNKDEAYVNAFRMLGSMFLNFVAPKYIQKGLDSVANKLFDINVNLDPLIMENKEFINAIKQNKVQLPKTSQAKDLFEFIDHNPDSLFSKLAQKQGKIAYLKNGIRDPKKYVDVQDLGNFRNELESFVKSASKSSNIDKFAKKAKFVKGANIISNVLISSTLLAVVLPKIQYLFNKIVTGSYSDPGLADNVKD